MGQIVILISIISLVILYAIAYFSNKDYKSKDDILGISESQWSALFVLWVPLVLMLIKELLIRW